MSIPTEFYLMSEKRVPGKSKLFPLVNKVERVSPVVQVILSTRRVRNDVILETIVK